MELRQKFEKDTDIQKTIAYCQQLCLEIEKVKQLQEKPNEFVISEQLNNEFLQSLKGG